MIRRYIIATLIIVCLIARPVPVSAASLKVMPLKYDAVLAKGEKKKGFVDFANADASRVTVTFHVEAFRQVDDQGNLEFYHDDALADGVKLDLDSLELLPRENVHLAFLLDGTKLPSGDSFGAIFATVQPSADGAAAQAVRVGTLLFIQNGTPSRHEASISDMNAPVLQIGESITAHATIKNTAASDTTNGFRPSLAVGVWPYSARSVEGPFIGAGRSRTVDYIQKGDYIGPVVVKVTTGSSFAYRVVFAVTGYWRWLAPLLIFVIVAGFWVLRRHRSSGSRKLARKRV